jgi:hypothetical protein
MNKITLEGQIVEIRQTEEFKGFAKRIFLVQDDPNARYPNTWPIEMWREDVDTLNEYSTRDRVRIEVDVIGKYKTNSRTSQPFCFTILRCLKIEAI